MLKFDMAGSALHTTSIATASGSIAEWNERRNVLAQIELLFWTTHALWRTGNLETQLALAQQTILYHLHGCIRTGRHRDMADILQRLCHG